MPSSSAGADPNWYVNPGSRVRTGTGVPTVRVGDRGTSGADSAVAGRTAPDGLQTLSQPGLRTAPRRLGAGNVRHPGITLICPPGCVSVSAIRGWNCMPIGRSSLAISTAGGVPNATTPAWDDLVLCFEGDLDDIQWMLWPEGWLTLDASRVAQPNRVPGH